MSAYKMLPRRFSAESLEGALADAAVAWGLPVRDLKYKVMEKGKKFLGMGKAKVEIEVTNEESSDDDALGKAHSLLEKLDGRMIIGATHDGVFLTVYPPQGSGRPVSLQEVFDALTERRLGDVDPAVVQQTVRESNGKPVRLADYAPDPERNGKVVVELSGDEMKAFITLAPPTNGGLDLELADVNEALKMKRVYNGIKQDVIVQALEKEDFNRSLLVAEGDLPVDGENGQIEFRFDRERQNKINLAVDEAGNIDYHELNLIENVVVGQVLGMRKPPTAGTAGKTVTGKVIDAKGGREVKVPAGKNVKISADGNELVAAINGQVIWAQDKVSVSPIFEVHGDVNFSTGNIVFLGNVKVYGSVEDGFRIKAAGDIEVSGTVGKAVMEAEGNILIRHGILGKGEGQVKAKGNVIVRFAENANIEAGGDVIIGEAVMHSNVDAGRRIILSDRKGLIIGGQLRATEEVNAKVVGSVVATHTDIEVGVSPAVRQQMRNLEQERKAVLAKLAKVTDGILALNTIKGKLGKLPPEKEQMLVQLSGLQQQLQENDAQIQEQVAELEGQLVLSREGRVSAMGIVYPGVKITIKDAILFVKDEYKFVSFFHEEGEVKIKPYEQVRTRAKAPKSGA